MDGVNLFFCWFFNLFSVLLFRSGDSLMPTEVELNRVMSHIQELLHTASDVSHDRCVKVLTARARVGRSSPTAVQIQGSLCSILDFLVSNRTAPWSA